MKQHEPVLIVEDERDTRDALATLLQMVGYRTMVAENGQRALELLKESGGAKPCLILLDLMMPVMNGWQFREAQRTDESIASIPVIVITADPAAENMAQPFGFSGFLKKPINFDQLSATIAAYC